MQVTKKELKKMYYDMVAVRYAIPESNLIEIVRI